jgi:succinate dehydrogenase / fumarate reductase flavoprotein subunit
MQGLADGYFVLPSTIGDYLAGFLNQPPVPSDDPAFHQSRDEVVAGVDRLLAVRGSRTVDWFHKELGKIMLEHCGMSRSEPGLLKALAEIPALYEEFQADVRILGLGDGFNQSLERAGRVEDYFELAQQMCLDALHREESCGGHFREEYQTEDGEALRRDDEYAHVAVWEWTGDPAKPELTVEELEFENVPLATRSYK